MPSSGSILEFLLIPLHAALTFLERRKSAVFVGFRNHTTIVFQHHRLCAQYLVFVVTDEFSGTEIFPAHFQDFSGIRSYVIESVDLNELCDLLFRFFEIQRSLVLS